MLSEVLPAKPGLQTRSELLTELNNSLSAVDYPKFCLAKIERSQFGLTSPERSKQLGLTLELDTMLGHGHATISLSESLSIDLMRKFGFAQNLVGKICWVYIEHGGAAEVRFVCFKDREYEDYMEVVNGLDGSEERL